MPTEETVEAPASPDNGNVPVDMPETPAPAPAAAPVEAAPVATTEPEQFELPDGRKVDAVTLTKEWKENFLPEFTKKSQELARLTNTPKTGAPIITEADPLADPEYAPKTYAELVKIAEERMLKTLDSRETAKAAERQAIETAVTEQLTAVKTIDKTVDENKLFLHATKYKFTDLRLAHQNMMDMAAATKAAKQDAAKNLAKRQDPVSVIPGASGGQPQAASNFANARDFLRGIQKP